MKRVRQRASGSVYRKQKKERIESAKKDSLSLQKWLSSEASQSRVSVSLETTPADSECESESTDSDDEESQQQQAGCIASAEVSSVLQTSVSEVERQDESQADEPDSSVDSDRADRSLEFTDIALLPSPVSDSLRTQLVITGTAQLQHKDGPFVSVNNRSLSSSWFKKTLSNGMIVPRTWLLYSPSAEAAFCFCCLLFGQADQNDLQKSSFGNIHNGFSSWQKLSPRVANHENSVAHRVAFLKWKELENRVTTARDRSVDALLQSQILSEQQKWRDVLDRILSTITFLAEQNLAFRGHRETLSPDDWSSNPGNFLAVLKLLAKYDLVIRQHIDSAVQNRHTCSYLSHDIQNEFIELLGKSVVDTIVADIRRAKYFTIMFDTTPDLAHREQMSQVIRYVSISGKDVEIKEAFLGFIEVHDKTAAGLTEAITSRLETLGLHIEDCRGQAFDNAAVMAGRKSGVQQRILQINPQAVFIPCDNHSLNLVGVHAAETSPAVVTFFGTIQEIYNFFSSSTHRWSKLLEHVDIAVKRQSETRWSARHDAVHAISSQLDGLLDALEELRDNEEENTKTRGDAASVLHSMMCLQFLVLLPFWDDILRSVNRVQQRLQDPTMNFREAAMDISALKILMDEKKDKLIPEVIENGIKKCDEWDIKVDTRVRRRRKMPGEAARDAGLTAREEISRVMHCVLDKIAVEMNDRFQQLMQLNDNFGFLMDIKSFLGDAVDPEELTKGCADLQNAYPSNIKGSELLAEIEDCRALLLMRQQNSSDCSTLPQTSLDLLKFIVSFGGPDVFPNLRIALQILLTIAVSVATCERSFSKLKLIVNYLRSTMSESRLNGLAMLSVERDVARRIDFSEVIDRFAILKARRVLL